MKILTLSNLYPPDFIGGYEIACAQVVDALRDRGHDVRVLTAAPRQPVDTPPHILRRFKLADEWNPNAWGTHLLTYRLHEAESRWVNAYNVHALTTVLEEFDPDVVYVCNLLGLGGLALMACLQYLRVPWAWQLGDCVPRLLCSTGLSAYPTLAEEFTKHIKGHYIVVSSQVLEEIQECGIELKGNVEIIPNWITGQRPPARESYYRGGHLRIMAVGEVGRRKGADVLIESAARLRDAGYEDFSVDLYGRLFDHDLRQLIQKHQLQQHLTLKGVCAHADVMQYYSQYDVLAFPTMPREPFGLVAIEAAGRGCIPLIAWKCGVAEWLVHGVHCLKAERSPEAFARALGAIIDQKINLEPIGRLGAEAAWRDFHIDAILPRIERMLGRAAMQPRRGAGTAAEAYRLARMAELLTRSFLHDAIAA
jgi:glycogen synthase